MVLNIIAKTIWAILFALLLVQVIVLVHKNTGFAMTNFRWISLTGAAAGLYYFIFERKKRNK